jgi:hypothetical protein
MISSDASSEKEEDAAEVKESLIRLMGCERTQVTLHELLTHIYDYLVQRACMIKGDLNFEPPGESITHDDAFLWICPGCSCSCGFHNSTLRQDSKLFPGAHF